MKIQPRHVENFLSRPDPNIAAVLIFGPDQGLARERVERLIKTILGEADDPFLLTTLSGADLRQDSAVLADEAAALSFAQGRRVVRVREATDGLAKTFAAFLDDPKGDAFVIVESGELPARSTLRKTFEQADNAAALACYADDERRLHQVIEETLRGHGVAVSPEAMTYLQERLGADRMVTRNELEKLALYVDENATVSLEDARACIGDSAAVSLDAVVHAAATGDQNALEIALRRVFAEGAAPVQILRACARHLQRLQLAAESVHQGQSPEQAIKALRPPVLFLFEESFRRQLSIWSTARLADAIDLVLDAEISCKTTGMPDRTICSRALMRLAQGAHVMARRASA